MGGTRHGEKENNFPIIINSSFFSSMVVCACVSVCVCVCVSMFLLHVFIPILLAMRWWWWWGMMEGGYPAWILSLTTTHEWPQIGEWWHQQQSRKTEVCVCVCVCVRFEWNRTEQEFRTIFRPDCWAGGTIGLNELVQHVESNLSNHSLRFDYVMWLLKGILSCGCVC